MKVYVFFQGYTIGTRAVKASSISAAISKLGKQLRETFQSIEFLDNGKRIFVDREAAEHWGEKEVVDDWLAHAQDWELSQPIEYLRGSTKKTLMPAV